jgi:hypothetical protein
MIQRRSIFFCIALAIAASVFLASFASCEARKAKSIAAAAKSQNSYFSLAFDAVNISPSMKFEDNRPMEHIPVEPDPESEGESLAGNSTTNGTTPDHGGSASDHAGDGHSWAPFTPIGPIIGWHSTKISETILVLCAFVMIIVLARIVMVAVPEKYRLSRFLPDSALMILLGCVIGICELIIGGGESLNFLFTFD